MKKKNVERFACIVVMTIFALTILAVGTIVAKEKVVIDYWESATTGTPWADAYKEGSDKFSATHPYIQVRFHGVGWGDIEKKTLTAIAAGNPPDVVHLFPVAASWGHAGFLTPLDKYDPQRTELHKFYPAVQKAALYNGKIYQLPAYINAWMVYYNKDVFKEVGLDPDKPPVLLEDLNRYAEILTKVDEKGNIERMGFLPAFGSWGFNWPTAFGAKLYDESSQRITANEPRMIELYEWRASFWKKYGVKKVAEFKTLISQAEARLVSEGPIYTGKIVMFENGQWQRGPFEQYAPQVDYGVTPNPYPSYGRPGGCWLECWGCIIPKGAKHPDEAWEFIKYFCTDYDLLTKLSAPTLGLFSPLKDLILSPKYIEKSGKPGRITLEPFLRVLETGAADPGPNLPIMRKYQRELNDAAELVEFGKKTAKEALDSVTEKMQKELDRILGK